MNDLSKHEWFFQFMPISLSPLLEGPFKIYPKELISPEQEQEGIEHSRENYPDALPYLFWQCQSIGNYLKRQRRSRAHKPVPGPPEWDPGFIDQAAPNLKAKLNIMLQGIRRICPTYLQPRKIPSNIFHKAMYEKSFLSAAYKQLYLQRKNTPPSYQTRIRDGVTVPSEENFLQAYAMLKNIKQLDSNSKSHILDSLNRTISTPALLFRQKILPSSTCPRCPVPADAQHLLLECDPAFYIQKSIFNFFHLHYPDFTIKEENVSFHIPIPKMNKKLNSQFIHLTASLSKLVFEMPKDPRYSNWTSTVFHVKILKTIADLLSLRKGCRWPYGMITKFHEFFSSTYESLDSYEFGNNMGHFRAITRVIE